MLVDLEMVLHKEKWYHKYAVLSIISPINNGYSYQQEMLMVNHVSVSTPPCTSKWNQELHLLCDVTRPLFYHQELLIVRHINKIHYL